MNKRPQSRQVPGRWTAALIALVIASGLVGGDGRVGSGSSSSAWAANLTWDSAPATAGITDGSGTWSTVVTNTTWWNGTSNVAWATDSSDTAVFGAGGAALNPSTVTVSGSVQAGGISFGPITTGRWVIQGGTIGLTDGAEVSFENGWNPNSTAYRIDSVLVGSNVTFRQNQSPLNGTQFNVNGANTLTGTTTIDGVFIQATMVGMGGGGAIDIKQNSMIDFSGTGTVSSPLTITGSGVGNRGAIRLATASSVTNQTLSGPITLAGDAMISVGGLAGAVISGAIGETAGGPNNLRFSVVSGTVQLRGASTYSGTSTISGGNGTVVLDGGNDRLPATTTLVTENSNMKLVLGGMFGGAMSQTFAGFGAINNTTRVVGGATGTSTFAANISSAASTYAGMIGGGGENENNIGVSKSGSGRLTLTGTSYTYTGDTTISGGTLALGASAAPLSSSQVIRIGSAGSSGVVFDLSARSGTYTFGSDQTVAGDGTINFGTGKTVASQGVWAPGNSIGSNAVTGNLLLSGTSQFELGTPGLSTSAPGTSDFTAVSGTLTLGGNLNLIDNADADGNGSTGGGVYRLFTYGNAVSGSFASVTTNPSVATVTSLNDISFGGAGTAAGNGVFLTVYDRASASFESGPTAVAALTLDFLTVNQGDVVSQNFNLYNLLKSAGFTADLALVEVISGTGNTNALTTNLATFNSLAPGTFNSWEASVDTSNQGTFSNTWTLQFKSSNGGTVYADDTTESLTLTANVIVVPEPSAIALAGVGIAAALWMLGRRARHP